MNPEASKVWRGPRWALAALLACLGMLGPFSIDTYLPAFTGIAASLGASPVEMQQTLSAYLLGFAVMNLFHGALADSFGRRPVVLGGGGGVHAGLGGLRDEPVDRRAGGLPGSAGDVGRRRHGGVAGGDP
jgi:MFS family permease